MLDQKTLKSYYTRYSIEKKYSITFQRFFKDFSEEFSKIEPKGNTTIETVVRNLIVSYKAMKK